jgi:enoyl-CoA hydratase/carnithine racemase
LTQVRVHHDSAIATLTVGTGDHANALTATGWTELAEAARDLASDTDVRAVVVAGATANAFCSGSDVREWHGATPSAIDASFAAMEAAFRAVEDIPVPVIARINGVAAGAGCQLACACDIRVATEDARIGMPIARWGILVPPSFAARLATLTGPGLARELLFTGRLVGGEEAVRVRLASASLPREQLDAYVAELLGTITAQPLAAVRAAKQVMGALLRGNARSRELRADAPTADHAAMQEQLTEFLCR